MSGMRNSPPISISSPRETTTFLPAGEALEGEEHGGGAIVHHERGLGACQSAEEAVHVGVARAAFLAGHLHLEIGVPGGHGLEPLAGQRREQGASEIRVEDHAGGVDHADEGERAALGEAGDHTFGEALGRGPRSPRLRGPVAAPRRAPRGSPR
jgi:hypothetical protein